MSAIELLKVRYGGQDYDTFLDEIRARALIKFQDRFNDLVASSLGIVLFDLVSYGFDSLAFYLDRRATDLYLPTAVTRSAVAKLVRHLGYKLRPASSSSTDLLVAPSQLYPFPMTLPAKTQWQDANGVIFETAQDVAFPANSTAAKTTGIRQGETRNFSFVSTGLTRQVFPLSGIDPGKFVVEKSADLKVNGSPWAESDFITFDETDQFEINYATSPPELIFGNGIAGNIPAAGATISMDVVLSVGKAGNIPSGSIDSAVSGSGLVSPFVAMFTSISFTFSQPKGATGGDDIESLESAKANAPNFFSARNVAVTKPDYDGLGTSFTDPLFGKVAVASASSPRGAENDAALAGYLDAIRAIVSPIMTVVQGDLDAIEVKRSGISALMTDVTALLGAISAQLATVGSSSDDARAAVSSGKSHAQQSSTDASSANDESDVMVSTIGAIGTAGSNQLTVGTKNALLASLTAIKSWLTSILAHAAAVVSSASTTSAAIDSIVTAETAAATSEASAAAKLVTAQTDSTAEAALIAAARVVVVDISASVEEQLQLIYDHVDGFLSSDCKSNLVNVSVLTRDAAGFYAAPSISLVKSLQSYYDARKEVTQTVRVFSGAGSLVLADITLFIMVAKGEIESAKVAAVLAVLDNILRERQFGKPLYLHEIHTEIYKKVTGLSFVNVRISGPLSLLDAAGNLIVPRGKVISKGTVSWDSDVARE